MAIVSMRRMSFIGLKKDKKAILDQLLRMGVVEISMPGGISEYDEDAPEQTVPASPKARELAKEQQRILYAINILEEYSKRKKPLFHARRSITSDEYARVCLRYPELMDILKQIEEIDGEITKYKTDINKLENKCRSLEPWRFYPHGLDQTGSKYTGSIFLCIQSKDQMRKLQQEIQDGPAAYIFTNEKSTTEPVYFTLTYHIDSRLECEEILRKYDCRKFDFQDMPGAPAAIIEDTTKEILDIKGKINDLESKFRELSCYLEDLEVLYDRCIMEIDQEIADPKLKKTKFTFSFEGWVPQKEERNILRTVGEDYVCHMSFRDPEKDEMPPTALSNGAIGSSAENVMKMYGVPNYYEYDPSGIAGVFYIIFFGFMLSDAGYGLLVTLLCGIVLKAFKLEESMRRFIRLFFMCGISTIFWGALFGGWFGDLLPTVTNQKFALEPLWFNPVENAQRLMVYAMGLGIIHLYVGLGIKAYNCIKRKKWVDAICDVGFWYIFFTGEILFLMDYVPYINEYPIVKEFQTPGLILLAIGFVLILFTKNRSAKNPFIRTFGGVTCLYSLVNMLSDVMSYTRMMAMGLATSVTINAFNLIGAMAGGIAGGGLFGSKVLGFVIFALIFIAANLFNLAINLLGSYVNAARLMFIEFFGKFFEGGGKEFEPLRQNTEYIVLSD